MDKISIIKKLVSFGERQLENEIKARKFIIELLNKNNLKYETLDFTTQIPKTISASLVADSKNIECMGSGLVSGEIITGVVFDSLDENNNISGPNINYNPLCESISRPDIIFSPSLSIKRKDVQFVSNAKKVLGKLEVEKIMHKTQSLLVGNLKNPKKIIFNHFDSLGPGAVDNASGVALCLNAIIENKSLLNENLFVFDSNEELSFDKPFYWGHGYRVFEKKYYSLLENAQEIIIVDGIGYDKTIYMKYNSLTKYAFPLNDLIKFSQKVNLITSDFEKLMAFYHSELDTMDNISEIYLDQASELLLEKLNNT